MLLEELEIEKELVSVSVLGPGLFSISPQVTRKQYSHKRVTMTLIVKIKSVTKAQFLSRTKRGGVIRLYTVGNLKCVRQSTFSNCLRQNNNTALCSFLAVAIFRTKLLKTIRLI